VTQVFDAISMQRGRHSSSSGSTEQDRRRSHACSSDQSDCPCQRHFALRAALPPSSAEGDCGTHPAGWCEVVAANNSLTTEVPLITTRRKTVP
jgi:hypothetical protein